MSFIPCALRSCLRQMRALGAKVVAVRWYVCRECSISMQSVTHQPFTSKIEFLEYWKGSENIVSLGMLFSETCR